MANNVILIEDKLVQNLEPITLTRTSLELLFGTSNIYTQLKKEIEFENISIFVRDYLTNIAKKQFTESKINKLDCEGDILVINSLVNLNNQNLKKLLKNKEKFITKSGTKFVCARIPSIIIKDIQENNSYQIIKKISNIKKYNIKKIQNNSLIKFPWELIKESSKAINNDYALFKKKSNNIKNVKKISNNKNIWISKNVNIIDKEKTYIDSTNGPVIIDDNVLIEPFSFIKGPVYIGKQTKILGARIYSNTSIDNNCIIGGEIQNSIIHKYTNKAHLGFIGHSIIGSWVNLGARTTNSNLKNTYGKISVNIGKRKVNTNEIKYGCMIGDNVKTAIGSLIFTGINIGVCSQLYGYTTENIPSFTIYKNLKTKELIEYKINKAILTQSRMMKRRNKNQDKHNKALLRYIFEMSTKQREENNVKQGDIRI